MTTSFAAAAARTGSTAVMGDDTIHAARGARDRINCGAGEDTSIVNAEKDRVAGNCETVRAR